MTRLLDFIVSIFILVVATPIMLVIALLIKCDSRGPIIYSSPRVGKDGKLFRMFRFRTVDIQKSAYLSMGERLTRVGSFIRNFSLDDLPNVFNLLKGELSLVGPRPTEPEEEYIQKKSFLFDMFVLREAVRKLIASKGNVKARGVLSIRVKDNETNTSLHA